MSYFEDLTPYTYGFGGAGVIAADEPWPELPLVNVGWLEPSRPFRSGAAPDGLVHALEVLATRYRVRRTRGFHLCGLCANAWVGFTGHEEAYDPDVIGRGSAEFRVKERSVVYAAPQLLVHYVAEHDYLPPDEFCVAAMNQIGAL